MTKTCGECKHYLAEFYHCQKNDVMAEPHNTCEDFEPKVITNGEKIIAGGMRAIAKFAYKTARTRICGMCAFATIENGRYVCNSKDDQSCVDGIEAWLNAPADCVKQNGDHDTQADLCKADNTESEGKMSKEYEFEWEKHTCGECTHIGDERSCLCRRMTAEHKACASFKSPPTVFDRITASPEVLAEKLVYEYTLNPPASDGTTKLFRSLLTGKNYYTKAKAIAATVAKLKEVAE